jgi:hypothetical protein
MDWCGSQLGSSTRTISPRTSSARWMRCERQR